MAAAFALRLAVGVAVYALACQANPKTPLATLNSWLLTWDANQYHAIALRLAEYWHGQAAVLSLGLPDKFLGYPMALAAVYYLLGPHPLWGVLVNCLAFWGLGLLAHQMALLLGQSRPRATWLALLVCLWPSSLAYSSALLKDSLHLLAVFTLITALGQFLRPLPGPRPSRPWPAGLGLVAGTYALIVNRPEFWGIILAIATTASLWSALTGRPRPWTWRPALACFLVGMAVFLGTHCAPMELLPAYARIKHSPRLGGTAPTSQQQTPPTAALASMGLESAWSQMVSNGLESLWQRRWEYAVSGGVSLLPAAHVLPDGPQGLAVVVASGLRDLLFYPCPWQRWPSSDSNLPLRLGVAAQSLAWYLLLPGLAWGLARTRWQATPTALAAASWALVVGLAIAVMVVNLGTLYRLRDMVLLPLLPFFSAEPYRKLLSPRSFRPMQ
ncbi:MAG: hypothetical protein HY794_18720 [Desulfarculus sp.]|nr:hypothetical protein [Desulfarculus sp.]